MVGQASPVGHDLHFDKEDEEANVRFVLRVPADATEGEFPMRAVVEYAGREFTSGYQTITARDLGRMNRYREAVHVVRTADIRMLGTPRVGYIMGSGDDVPQSLGMLEIQPQMLTGTELAGSDLSAFDVILVGVRAYAVRPDIRKYNARLLDYVRQGGVLIVQYQTPEFDNNYGPYPYQMGRRPEEVSEEDATVTILEPDHPLFATPNRITSADFEGWLEQRGSKFWTTWDERYVPLLECHDTGQEPQRGGMLIARHGQGVYVYSAYAWYRQLPHGVTGAFRLFANMLSLPRSRGTSLGGLSREATVCDSLGLRVPGPKLNRKIGVAKRRHGSGVLSGRDLRAQPDGSAVRMRTRNTYRRFATHEFLHALTPGD